MYSTLVGRYVAPSSCLNVTWREEKRHWNYSQHKDHGTREGQSHSTQIRRERHDERVRWEGVTLISSCLFERKSSSSSQKSLDEFTDLWGLKMDRKGRPSNEWKERERVRIVLKVDLGKTKLEFYLSFLSTTVLELSWVEYYDPRWVVDTVCFALR